MEGKVKYVQVYCNIKKYNLSTMTEVLVSRNLFNMIVKMRDGEEKATFTTRIKDIKFYIFVWGRRIRFSNKVLANLLTYLKVRVMVEIKLEGVEYELDFDENSRLHGSEIPASE